MVRRFTVPALIVLLVSSMTFAAAAHQTERQAQVERKSERVMPFSMNGTMHTFVPTASGGIQTVSDHTNDVRQVALVRSHLRKEAAAFARGHFDDPAAIHGNAMPGLQRLRTSTRRMTIRYADVPSGASITFRSHDATVVAAIHAWFDAQRHDHGSHAKMTMSQQR